MNGVNAPKVVECLGSDGGRYRQLAKSGNDDLRQDAVRILTAFSFYLWHLLLKFHDETFVFSLWKGLSVLSKHI